MKASGQTQHAFWVPWHSALAKLPENMLARFLLLRAAHGETRGRPLAKTAAATSSRLECDMAGFLKCLCWSGMKEKARQP